MEDQDSQIYDLTVELKNLGLAPAWLEMVCGVDRTTVWRWLKGRQPIPVHVRTIIRQNKTIRGLYVAMTKAD